MLLSLYHSICSLEVIVRYDSHPPEDIPHFTRAVMRLLHLHSSGRLTESQWSDLLSLKSHKDKYKATGGSLWLDIETQCRLIREWTSTDAEDDVLESLICSVSLSALRELFHIYPFT